MYKTWFMGTLDSVTCTSAIFAWWKVRGSKFAQPPDGGVFGSGVLRRVWCVTRTACLFRILTRTAQAVSERARQSTSQRRRRRASRAPVTVEDAVGGAGSHRSTFARSERAGQRWSCTSEPAGGPVTDQRLAGMRPPFALDHSCGMALRTPVRMWHSSSPAQGVARK